MSVQQPDASTGALPSFVVYFNKNSDWIRPDGRQQLESSRAGRNAPSRDHGSGKGLC